MRKPDGMSVFKQVMLGVVFFAILAGFIGVSVYRSHKKAESGQQEATTNAVLADYMIESIGNTINENTDKIDQSYGDYFYIGADFYEITSETELILWNDEGIMSFAGDDTVTDCNWVYGGTEVTSDDAKQIADELSVLYGDYTEEDGNYYFRAAEGKYLGQDEALKTVVCGFDEKGHLYLSGSASEL